MKNPKDSFQTLNLKLCSGKMELMVPDKKDRTNAVFLDVCQAHVPLAVLVGTSV